jgi:hypothetical protein
MNDSQQEFSQAERLLLDACIVTDTRQHSIASLYAKLTDAVAWEAAQSHELEGPVAHRLVAELGSDKVPAHWHLAHRQTQTRIESFMAEMDRIGARFSDAGFSCVALKNAGIARAIFSCRGCAPMGDIDLLLGKDDYPRAHQILIEDGYECASRNPTEEAGITEGRLSGGSEYFREISEGHTVWVELQWRPVAGRWIRPDQEPPANDMMQRSVAVPGTKIRILSPEDNLLQVALHTAKHTYLRAPGLRLHCDVERIVSGVHIDWSLFLERVKQFKVRTVVYFSLAIPARLFGTPVPEEVLAELKPPEWKSRLIWSRLQKAGFFYPARKKFTNLEYMLLGMLLYDDMAGVWKAAFPSSQWMKSRYQISSTLSLPYYYARRWTDLTFRRVGL